MLTWTPKPDPERQGATIYTAHLEDGSFFTVQEMAVDDWGWTLSEPDDGFAVDFRYGFADAETAKLKAQEHQLARERSIGVSSR